MKYRVFAVFVVLITCISVFAACIPPFIDGAIDVQEYFESNVKCKTFIVNPAVDGGYEINNDNDIPLSFLTDSDENNIDFKRYYSFTLIAYKEITLSSLAFIIEANDEVTIELNLEDENANIFTQSINLSKSKKEIVQFSNLNLNLTSGSYFTITVKNPLLSNIEYRIDTIIFIA